MYFLSCEEIKTIIIIIIIINLKTGNGKPPFAVKWSNLDLDLQLIKRTPI